MNAEARKPNLFIVGGLKCGTTAWYEYLRSHPDIFMSDPKEPCYFALDLPNWRAVKTLEQYSDLFADAGAAKVIGEASAIYLISTAAADQIRRYNPSAKILIFLRDQEEYLPSLHNQFLSEFADDIRDFETAWRLSGRRSPDMIPPTAVEPATLDYAAMGRFLEQVERYFRAFQPHQVHAVHYRDWITSPRETYLEILEFLGLDDDGRTDFPRINRGVTFRSRRLVRFLHYPPAFARRAARLFKLLTGVKTRTQNNWVERFIRLLSAPGYKQKISPALREEIRAYYAEDNRRLEELLASARSSQE